MTLSRGIGKGAHLRKPFKIIGTCLVYNCTNLQWALGVCNKHYLRIYNHRVPYIKPNRYRRDVLAAEVAAICEVPKYKAHQIINAIVKAMTDALQNGDSIRIAGFGTFDVHHLNRYVYGSNCYFKPAKILRQMINEG